MIAFSLGGLEHERVAVEVASYERAPLTGDYHDDNWLIVTVTVSVGAFDGRIIFESILAHLGVRQAA